MDMVATAVLIVQLVVIAVIDMQKLVIPDICNFALGATGILFAVVSGTFDLLSTLLAIVVFGGTFAIVRLLHSKATSRIGLGMGDVKMAAAAACWLAASDISIFLAVSSLAGLAYAGGVFLVSGERSLQLKVPFGPFLGMGLLITWFIGADDIGYLLA